MTRVGFAGLGRMGAPMATNLAKAGFDLTLWNRSAEKANQLASAIHASQSRTPKELAESSDVVVTMLADDGASNEVHKGVDGLFEASGGAGHIIEMGTLSPRHIQELSQSAGDRVIIDAPVSGSIDAARDAQLMIMVGAGEGEIQTIEPVLSAMGRQVICLGRRGTGATMKLAINMLIHGLNQTLAEAMALAEAAGISAEDAYQAMEQSAAAAPMLTYRKPQYLDEDSSPVSFALSLARKDVSLAIDLASNLGVPMPQAQVNLDQLQAAEAAGLGERDMAAMLAYVRAQR